MQAHNTRSRTATRKLVKFSSRPARMGLCALLATTLLTVFVSAKPRVHAASALADTTSGVHLAMIFNAQVPVTNGVASEPGVDYVYGAMGSPPNETVNIPSTAGMNGYYVPWSQDGAGSVGVSWFQQYHPDWLLYQCNQTALAQYPDPGNPPVLDWSQPAVQQYMLNKFIFPALASGYGNIAFDDNPSYNMFKACGHFTASGTWVQQYNGAYADSGWSQAQATILSQLRAAILAQYPSATIAINNGYFPNQTTVGSFYDAPNQYANLLVDEGAFFTTQYVTTAPSFWDSNPWLDKMNKFESLQKAGHGIVEIFQTPYTVSSYMTDTNGQARADMQWCLANYLLSKYSHTYFFWAGNQQYSQLPYLQSEESAAAAIGSPTDDFYAGQGVYMRDFSNGLSIVNPSNTTTYSISLPAGKYQDLYGNSVNSQSMGPHTGLVLLDKSAPPTPTATSSPTPAPTSTTAPTATPTVAPTSTHTAVPTSTPTRVPTSTPTTVPASTPAPTSTPTRVPTSTPTPMPAAPQPIVNGGFESGTSPWQAISAAAHQLVTATRPYSGRYSAQLCGYSTCSDRIAQTFVVPSSFSRLTVTFQAFVQAQTTSCHDVMQVKVRSGSGAVILALPSLCNGGAVNTWQARSSDVTSALVPYRGQSVQISFEASTGWSHPSTFFVDSVALNTGA